LIPRDLSRAGWRSSVDRPGDGCAVIAGREMPLRAIKGVLNRLAWIAPEELTDIAPLHREYAAAEMTAFLTHWLSMLPCTVLNRPAPGALVGPAWRQEFWLSVAMQLDIPTVSLERSSALAPRASWSGGLAATHVTVIGADAFGNAHSRLHAWTRQLAAVAQVELLVAHWDGADAHARFLSADAWADVTAPEIAGALAEYLSN
jgi:hypothetical protein